MSHIYHDTYLWSLSVQNKVSVHPASKYDFFDYNTFFKTFYRDDKGKVKQNHISNVTHKDSRYRNQYQAWLWKSNLPVHEVDLYDSIKKYFDGNAEYPANFKLAVDNGKMIIMEVSTKRMKPIDAPCLNV